MEPLVQPEQWEYLAQPAPPGLLGLTVLQEPPASLEFLVLLVQPGSTGQQVRLELLVSPEQQALPELSVFQELRVRLVLRAVMVLLEQQALALTAQVALQVLQV
jgi:hypothetical protein